MDSSENTGNFEVVSHGGAETPGPSPRHLEQLLAEADVVFAVDSDTQSNILVFGREKLRQIAASDVPEGARVLRVKVGRGEHRLERLLALVERSKGYHDYHESA